MVMRATVSAKRKLSSDGATRIRSAPIFRCGVLRLDDAVKLKAVAIVEELQPRRLGVGRIGLGKQDVEIIERAPVQPESRHPGQRMIGRLDKLGDRRRRPIAKVGIIAKFRADMQYLLALDRKQSRDQPK